MLTVLGKTFTSNDERREYFRNELRKQLPELKKIEGFPIGEDEDIIALSDPPYYTACPNPWLNDFIAEWEEGKKSIPNRVDNFHVAEPYASDVSEGKNNPIYNAHSYHTKVPHPAIMRYILHYTQPGDIVFDGFAGTGMTGVAAQLCGSPDIETKLNIEREWKEQFGENEKPKWGARNAIVGDLSPIASFIAYNYNTPVDVQDFERESIRILGEARTECGWMYTTLHCPILFNAEQVVNERYARNQTPSEEELSKRDHSRVDFDRFVMTITERLRGTDNPANLLSQNGFDELGREFDFPDGFVVPAEINYMVWSDVFICSNCSEEIIFWETAVDHVNGKVRDQFRCSACDEILTKRKLERAKVTEFDRTLKEPAYVAKTVPVSVNYKVGHRGVSKGIDNFDKAIIEKVLSVEDSSWFPADSLPDGYNTRQPINSHGLTHVHQFYTRRNLIILSRINSRIFRNQHKLLFNSQLINISKLNRHRPGVSFPYNPLNGTLYVGSQVSESNIFTAIENKVKKLVAAFSLILRHQTVTQQSAVQFSNIKSGTVDYVFTDPPFGANIMYSELNFLWESWLKIRTNNQTEAIENSVQGKSLLDYQELMANCFHEYFRVLKAGGWMTVEFSNTSAAVWNGIQTALQRVGFIIANIAALDKQAGSFKAVTTPTAVKQDLVISCYKPSLEFETNFNTLPGTPGVWEFIREHLEHLPVTIKKAGNSTAVVERSPKILYDRLITFFVMRNLPVPLDAAEFQAGLRQKFDERCGMYFLRDQAAEYDEAQGIATQKGEQLRLVFDLIYSESDALLWLQERLKLRPQTYQDIQPDYRKANVANRKGELPTELGTLLEENFIQNSDNTWRVPDLNEAKDREALRNKSLLKEFGDYITLASGGKKLKEVRVEALRAGFKNHWERKEFKTIIDVAEKIPNNILLEDEQLLMYYDIAQNFV